MLFWLLVWLTVLLGAAQAQSAAAFSVAVLPPQSEDASDDAVPEALWTALEQALRRAGLSVLPRAWVQSAVGNRPLNFNPTCAEAHAVGARVGSAGYVLAAVRRGARSMPDRRTVTGGTLHLFAVETRTGQLLTSEHPTFTEDDRGFHAAIIPLVEAAAARFATAWQTVQAKHAAAAGQDDGDAEALDLRTGAVPPAVTPPVPLTRIQPQPTEAATLAGLSATVQAEVLVTAGGVVADVRIVRWAGYGLEAAVETALRATRFRPTTHHGQPVAARLLVEFNFRPQNHR